MSAFILNKNYSQKAQPLVGLTRIRLPKNESTLSIVRKIYSGKILKAIRKFEKIDYKLRSARLDISFLVVHQNENICFVWLIKTFEILLTIQNVSKVPYRQKTIIRNHISELCKMN